MTRDGPLLLLCLALALPGCIFAEPPERSPQQTPVHFDLDGIKPLTTQLLVFGPNDPQQEFIVQVSSEDAGEIVRWVLHLNLTVGGTTNARIGPRDLEPSTQNDTSREIRFSFSPFDDTTTPPPCVQLTLMACHDHAFNGPLERCTGGDDTAIAVWWAAAGDDPATTTFADCPQQAQTP